MAVSIDRIKQILENRKQKNEELIYKAQQSSSASTPAPATPVSEPKEETSLGNFSWLSMMQGDPTSANNQDAFNKMESITQSVTDYAKGSNAYYKYLASDEEKQSEAKRVSIETGIPVNALLMSDENLALGRSVQEYRRKKMAFALDGESDFDLSAVYEKFPGLQAIVENPNMSENDVAIAMHNIEDLTKTKTAAEAFSLGLEADKANYRIGEIGTIGFLGGEITPEMRKEIETLQRSIPEQKAMPNFFDDPLTVIAGGTGANIYHMERGVRRGAQMATAALAAGVGVSVASGGTLAAPAMTAAITSAGIGVRSGMVYDMFLNSAGRYYNEYSEMKQQDGRPLLKKSEARTFAAIAAGLETGIEFWNYGEIMNLLGASYKREIMSIVAKVNGDQNIIKAGLRDFFKERGSAVAKAVMTETAEEAVQDISDKAVHNAIITYAPHAADRKYTGTEFARGALEASTEALPGIIGLSVLGGAASNIKSVRDFARLQKEQNDIFFSEMKLANGLGMVKSLQENMANSKLFKKNPDIYQAVVKSAVENTEFKEVRIDTELALEDEAGAQVFNQLTEAMGLDREEVNAIIENKADLVVPTEIYAQTVLGNDNFDRYISFDEKGHSMARKKYYMAVAEDMAKKINVEQDRQQAELIDGIITANFPEAGIEQDLGAAVILTNPANPKQAWVQMKRDITDSIDARLGGIVKRLEEGMSRGVHYYYSEDSGYSVKRMTDNDAWYGEFYKKYKRRPNKAELREMAREVYKGGGEKYGMPEYTFEVTEDMQADFDSLDNAFEEMYALDGIKDKVDNLTASEMAVVRSLTPSGYKVYQAARGRFQSGNTDVQKAGRMNAILLARYADRMADNIAKITGKPYTAEDYMRERIYIMADAENADTQGYGQPITNPDLDLDREVEVLDLDTMSDALKGKSPKEVLAYIKEISDNTQVPTADFKAMVGLPKNIDTYGQKHIIFSKSNKQRKNIVARNKVLANFFKIIFATRVVEVSPNKKIKEENLTKTQKRKNEVSRFYRLFVPVKMNGNLYTLLITAEDFNKTVEIDVQEVSLYEISAKKIEDTRPSATLNVQGTIPSKISIREVLQGVKDVDGNPYINSDGSGNFAVYNQTAYHGSPHKFDTFDLGAIGTGEGRQVHGWGLYFAQDRKVAKNYRIDLAGASYTLNGKDLNDVYRDLERKGEWDKLTVLEDYMVRQDIVEMDGDDYDSSAWKWFKQIYPKIKGEGSLFEVDIPDSDVLLDEDKPLSEQPLKVRKAILEFYRQRPDDFIAPKSENDLGASMGYQFYHEVAFQMRREGYEESSERAASETLNALGIKGITYDSERDGRCFVVFDDKAISVIERYNQAAAMRNENKAYVTNSQGNVDWGYINGAVADNGTQIKKAPVRMQIGFQVGKDKAGNGYTHIHDRHLDFIQAKGYKGIEDAVYDVLDDHDFIVQEETATGTRLKLIKDLSPKTSIMLTLDLVTDENTGEVFYAPNSLLPRSKKQVEGEKRKALVFPGERSPQDQSPATGAFRASSGKNAGSVEGSFARKNTSAFDTISISEAEKYVKKFTYSDVEQHSANQSVRGQTKISGMSRVVSLFENADKSTFVHELGHVALADLKMLAEMEGAPAQLVKDWQTVKDWLGYKDKQGFTREQHEQFARGFEAYLRTGKAPVRGLKAVFRTFKKWLCDIYADFVQLGGKPSPEVQAVMARMLASEQEIEAEAKMQGIESITKKKGMQILDDSTQAMYERWVAEAKEEAKEKVMKAAMQDVSDRFAEERKAVIESMRENIENELKEKDIFRAEECVRVTGNTDILPMLGYTEESYRSELEANGGSLQKAVEEELAKAVADLDSNKVSDEQIRIEAEKALSSSEYKAMILTAEYEALARKEENEKRLDKTVTKALDDIEKDLRGDTAETKKESAQVKSLKQKIADLKYTYRWREAEMRLIEQMQKAEAKEEKEAAVNALRAEIAKSDEGIRLVRDAVEGQLLMYRKAAKENITKLPLRQATATYSWRQKERMKGAEVARLMAKGKWKEAKEAKLEQVTYSYFADESAKLKEHIEIQIRKLKKRSRSINKGNAKMDAEGRYFYQHLLYVFGINRQDALMPQGWENSGSLDDLFKRYTEEYNVYVADEDKKDEDSGKPRLPQFIKEAVSRRDVYQEQVDIVGRKKPVSALGYNALTKSEWDELLEILSKIYTVSNNANRLYTVVDSNGDAVSFDDAVQRIVDGIRANIRIKENKDTTGATKPGRIERLVTAAGDLSSELIKPETIFLQNDGDKDGASMMFLYDPIKRASDKELKMKTASAKAMQALFAKHGMKDWNKKSYKFDKSAITKEQAIVIALNWGTEINRKRIMDGYHVTEEQVMKTLSNLDKKDWDLVTALWEHIGSFWEETVAVEERMTGVGLKKQEAVPFTVTAKDGSVYEIKGGYYPIMYDPNKSIKAADQKQNDIAKQQMSGNAVLGTGRGHTKSRSQETIDRQVYTTLEPLSKSIDNVIHNICCREAVRDVNKLLNNKEVVNALQEAHGMKVVRDLHKWVRDNWAMDEKKDGFSRAASFLRRNMTMAVMAYRVMPALLNVTNIFPMIEYIGAGRALHAVTDFARNHDKVLNDCKTRSVFLAERAQTMDRDIREKLTKSSYTAWGKSKGYYNKYAFKLMAQTDLMFAAPLWKSEYTRVWQEQSAKGLRPEVIEQNAVAAGDAAVRRVFGSGDVKDLAPVQRGSEVAKGLTMYFSYMNTVYNALALKGAIAKNKRTYEAWGDFARSILCWCVLTFATEQIIREIMDDGDDDWTERVGKRFEPEKAVKSFGENVTGMIPLGRDVYKAIVDVITDGRAYNPSYTSAYDSIARMVKAAQTIRSEKTDLVDVGREVTRAINTFTGLSDTITDGIWTLFRIGNRDIDTEVGEALKAIIFDRKLKKGR